MICSVRREGIVGPHPHDIIGCVVGLSKNKCRIDSSKSALETLRGLDFAWEAVDMGTMVVHSIRRLGAIMWLYVWVILLCVLGNVLVFVSAFNSDHTLLNSSLPQMKSRPEASPGNSLMSIQANSSALYSFLVNPRKKRHNHVLTPSTNVSSIFLRRKREMASFTSTIRHCLQSDVKGTDLRHGHMVLNVAVFAPYLPQFMFAMERVLPAVQRAEENIQERRLLPGYRFHWLPGNSKCNSRDAAMHAFQMVTRYRVALFLGPVCDYSLAPVARYAPYWDLPIIAPGGFAHNFGTDKLSSSEGAEYPLLTRVGYTFNSMALTFLDVLTYFRWGKVKVLYDSLAHDDIVPRFCHLAAGAFGFYLQVEKRRVYDMYRLKDILGQGDMLKEELGTDYAGEF